MASLDARKTPLPTLWKPTPIFLCPFVANNEVLRILIKISFPRRHPYFSLFLFIQVSYKIILVLVAFCELYTKRAGPFKSRGILPLTFCFSCVAAGDTRKTGKKR